ncbi:hypothetical protein Tco_1075917 [Tanacetum coccineum]
MIEPVSQLQDEVKDVNEDGYETYGDNEEPILETTQNPKPKTSTPSKDVESSMAENVVKVEPVEFNATPPQGKCGIVKVRHLAATRLFLNGDVLENHVYIKRALSPLADAKRFISGIQATSFTPSPEHHA